MVKKKSSIKADKTSNMKQFEVELLDIGLDERTKINNMVIDQMNNAGQNIDNHIPPFDYWTDIIFIGTDWTKEDVNKYDNDQIMAIAGRIIEKANKKK